MVFDSPLIGDVQASQFYKRLESFVLDPEYRSAIFNDHKSEIKICHKTPKKKEMNQRASVCSLCCLLGSASSRNQFDCDDLARDKISCFICYSG